MDLWNQCIKIDKMKSSDAIEKKWRQAQAFDSIVSYVLEQETVDPGSTFVVKELNELYVDNLKLFCIKEKSQTTHFTERLLTTVPNIAARIRFKFLDIGLQDIDIDFDII